ncbi:MAG: hypothetical protein A2341_26030 [Deltaproteobacteria bacterium RIFOXYB12_FULL_58_9]|nr:MAG: hypothetical protein A2341_26030 [Deltaproteobacteria bacterium RIFOXYB12_FULL_58_9]
MSGILAIVGNAAHPGKQALERMAAAAPNRGDLQTIDLGGACIGVQVRPWGAASSRPGLACRDGVVVAAIGAVHHPTVISGRDAAEAILDRYHREENGPVFLHGSVAYVLWDSTCKQLVLQRDPVGMRPLFYCCQPESWVIASEVKQVLAAPGISREILRGGVLDVCLTQTPDGTTTFYEQVAAVAAGTCLRFSRAATTSVKTWKPPDIDWQRKDTRECADELRRLLAQAVARETTDPTAILLSGGLDSTAVAAAALVGNNWQNDGKLTAISAVYPHHPAVNEDELITQTAERLGLRVLRCEPKPRPFDSLHLDVALHDGPAFGPFGTNLRPMLQTAYRNGHRILFDGHDGDGLLGCMGGIVPALASAGAWRVAARYLKEYRQVTGKGWHQVGRRLILPALVGHRMRHAWQVIRRRMRNPRNHNSPCWAGSSLSHSLMKRSEAQISSWPEAQQDVVGPIGWACLESLEREALAAGVELLHPFGDLDLVEFALALPPHIKAADGMAKGLLRQAFRGRLPDTVLNRRTKLLFNSLYVEASTPEDMLAAAQIIEPPGDWVDMNSLRTRLAHASDMDHSERMLLQFVLEASLLTSPAASRPTPTALSQPSTAALVTKGSGPA